MNTSISKILTEFVQMFNDDKLYREFEAYCHKILELNTKCKITYTDEKSDTKTYGHYDPASNEILIYRNNRSMGDVFRTLAHELVHARQNELGLLTPESGDTGSDIENQANADAGIIMRRFGKLHPEIYQ